MKDNKFHVFFVSALIGVFVGLAIALYDFLCNDLLWANFSSRLPPFLLFFLPLVGMLLTGLILKIFKVSSPSMADEVVKAYHHPGEGIEYSQVIPKYIASLTTIGFGASAGMEGASKWVGATLAALIQKKINQLPILKKLHGRVETILLAGGAAGIAAIFRAPLTGAIMGVESPYKKDLAHEALLHALVASACSYSTFILFRPSSNYFPISFHYVLNYRDLFFSLILGVLAGLSSRGFLNFFSLVKKIKQDLKIPFLFQYLLGGLFLSALAYFSYFLTGKALTLQAGLPVANDLLAGVYPFKICLLIFILKILATCITFGFGGVGGLFVPSATIGAALGAMCDLLFMPSQPGLFTLLGIAAFTGASYNSLLFSAVFIAEATGSPALVVPALLASSVAYAVSLGYSNSASQKMSREF